MTQIRTLQEMMALIGPRLELRWLTSRQMIAEAWGLADWSSAAPATP